MKEPREKRDLSGRRICKTDAVRSISGKMKKTSADGAFRMAHVTFESFLSRTEVNSFHYRRIGFVKARFDKTELIFAGPLGCSQLSQRKGNLEECG